MPITAQGKSFYISPKCVNLYKTSFSKAGVPHQWGVNAEKHQVVSLPYIEDISPRPKQFPQALPRDLADRLKAVHGYPFVWFLGQFVRYLMRPNEELQNFITSRREALGFQHPIVGYDYGS